MAFIWTADLQQDSASLRHSNDQTLDLVKVFTVVFHRALSQDPQRYCLFLLLVAQITLGQLHHSPVPSCVCVTCSQA